MPSVHKRPGRPTWYCFYRDRKGERRYRSTGTKIKREAVQICARIQEIENRARSGHITPDRARRVIESTVSDIMESLGVPLEQKTVRQHFDAWLGTFKAECRPATFSRYEGVKKRFLEFLEAKADRPLATLTSLDIERYREDRRQAVASRTVNTHLKVLRVALERAVRQRIFEQNPARSVDNVDTSDRHERRAFTVPELKRLLAVVGEEWRTAVLIGTYTGLRLGDIAGLTWSNLDLQEEEIAVRTRKTDRFQRLPLARPLLRHIESLSAGDDPRAPLCPSLHGKTPGWLSNQFHELLASAGLTASRGDHQKKEGKQGRGARRQMNALSFHSLRHTATSLLKNAGVSDVVARDIIGHESEAISRSYTHIEGSTKRKALNKLPDVTK